MTQWGWMKEELARWEELSSIGLHMTSAAAGGFGLKVMLAGVVSFVIGFLMTRSTQKGR